MVTSWLQSAEEIASTDAHQLSNENREQIEIKMFLPSVFHENLTELTPILLAPHARGFGILTQCARWTMGQFGVRALMNRRALAHPHNPRHPPARAKHTRRSAGDPRFGLTGPIRTHTQFVHTPIGHILIQHHHRAAGNSEHKRGAGALATARACKTKAEVSQLNVWARDYVCVPLPETTKLIPVTTPLKLESL